LFIAGVDTGYQLKNPCQTVSNGGNDTGDRFFAGEKPIAGDVDTGENLEAENLGSDSL
jgi:hypothetical protein